MVPNDAHLRQDRYRARVSFTLELRRDVGGAGLLRQLAEWRHHGRVIPLPPRPAAVTVQVDP